MNRPRAAAASTTASATTPISASTTIAPASMVRHYWELCVLLELRDGLRSGDVWVPGSRRYADPSSYLMTEPEWERERAEFCRLVGRPPDAAAALAGLADELDAAVDGLDETLAGGDRPVRLDDGGHLVIGHLGCR